jgi:hypothetical protein
MQFDPTLGGTKRHPAVLSGTATLNTPVRAVAAKKAEIHKSANAPDGRQSALPSKARRNAMSAKVGPTISEEMAHDLGGREGAGAHGPT